MALMKDVIITLINRLIETWPTFSLSKLFALYKLHHPTVSNASENSNVFKRDLNFVILGSARKVSGKEFQAAGADEPKAGSARRFES